MNLENEKELLEGKSIYLRDFHEKDAVELLRLQLENRPFFEKYSMSRPADFYTEEAQEKRIWKFTLDKQNDEGYNFGIFHNETHDLLGTINLFQVLRGSLQSAFIGYFLDRKFNGRGFTTEAVKLIVRYGFDELKLHRIEAGVMPHNSASIRVLEKSGFHKEGIARKNVNINGKWEDHQVLAIINPADE
ncbi:GNAT family N-acetyltransferase [Bacillus salacetis]|uniref:GNAT family N-acetyltransferase n=1 Tax=Bacillus salacetis TaxID=2315464 RepID=UPI003B9FFA58